MKIFITLFLALSLYAKTSISVEEVLKENFNLTITVEKKNLILTKEEAKTIQQEAKVKLDSKIVRVYLVKEEGKILGYGVLLKKRIRTKNAAVLYMIDSNKTTGCPWGIKAIEILSFSEPREYKPNKAWQSVFTGKSTDDMLIAGKDIPTISGATMSADALSKAARLALAIIKVKMP